MMVRAVPSLSKAPVTVKLMVVPTRSASSPIRKRPGLKLLETAVLAAAALAAAAAEAATVATGVGVTVGVTVTVGVDVVVPAGLKPLGNDAAGTEIPPVELDPVDDPTLPMLAMSGPGLIKLSPLITKLMPSMAVLMIVFRAPKTFEIRFNTVLATVPATLKAAPMTLPMIGAAALTTSKKA